MPRPRSRSDDRRTYASVPTRWPGPLADRGFYGFALWEQAVATGADLLWRMGASQRLDPIEVFDGSYLSKVFEVRNFKRRGEGMLVRVIDYMINDGRDNDNVHQLITMSIRPTEGSSDVGSRRRRQGSTPAGSASSQPCAARATPSQRRAPFPLSLTAAGETLSGCSANGSTGPPATDPTRG